MYKQMIYDLIKLLEEKHLDCYFNITNAELNNYVEKLLSEDELNDEYDFYYISNKIIKKMFDVYDSHTRVIFKNAPCNFPIRLKYIDDKLYIVKTDDEHKDILYSQILKINDVDINQLINELDEIIAYSTKEYFEGEIERVFFNGKKIKVLPSMKKDREIDSFKYTILKDSEIKEIKLDYSDKRFNESKNYTYEIEDNTIVIHYTACVENHDGQMNEFVETIRKEAESNNIDNFIVDIRDNMGGNSNIIKPLIEYLKDKKVIALTDKYVFSGGRFALIDLQRIGAQTVGTGIGTSINCFGNISRNDVDNFIIPVSYKYYCYDGEKIITINSKEQFNEIKEREHSEIFFKPIIFEPDYYVENSIEDVKN